MDNTSRGYMTKQVFAQGLSVSGSPGGLLPWGKCSQKCFFFFGGGGVIMSFF